MSSSRTATHSSDLSLRPYQSATMLFFFCVHSLHVHGLRVQTPGALALTESGVMLLLYFLLLPNALFLHQPWATYTYSFLSSVEDVVLFSLLRCLIIVMAYTMVCSDHMTRWVQWYQDIYRAPVLFHGVSAWRVMLAFRPYLGTDCTTGIVEQMSCPSRLPHPLFGCVINHKGRLRWYACMHAAHVLCHACCKT